MVEYGLWSVERSVSEPGLEILRRGDTAWEGQSSHERYLVNLFSGLVLAPGNPGFSLFEDFD